MEDTKLVKKITDWNPKGVRTKGQEVINDLKKLKLRKWSQLSKTENPEVIWCKDQHSCRVVLPGEGGEGGGGGEEEEVKEKAGEGEG